MKSRKCTLLIDEKTASELERLRTTYGLENKAEVYDLATRVLDFVMRSNVHGYEFGRSRNDAFEALLTHPQPDAEAYLKFQKAHRPMGVQRTGKKSLILKH